MACTSSSARSAKTWFNPLLRYALVEKGRMTIPSADLNILSPFPNLP